MPLKAVLFDLDGTFLDTAPDFFTTLNLLRAEEKLESLGYDIIRRTVSNGARALIDISFEHERDSPEFNRLLTRLLEIYSQNLADKTGLFAGMEQVLDFIAEKNLAWGIVTNKSSVYTVPILSALKLVPPPATVVCPDHVSQTKPHPEPLLLACDQIKCQPNEAIYVGDHLRDIDCGKSAGMPTVAVSYGYIDAADDPSLWRADYLIDKPLELIPIIEKYL
jgi:phosphoglycolate phosphatase